MTSSVLALPGNEAFANSLGSLLDAPQIIAEFRRFPDGETYVRIDSPCSDRVFLVCTLDHPDDKFLPIAYAAQAARNGGASEVTLVAPYLGYMRQDIAFQPGEAVTAPIFAQLVSGIVDGLVTVDPHLHRIANLGDVYSVPATNVHAAPAVAAWIDEHVDAPLLVGPDSESKQWVSAVAAEIEAPYVALRKVRSGDRDVAVSVPDLDRHPDRTPVIVDDIISTARTMIETVRHLIELQPRAPICVGVHGIFAGDAYDELLAAGADRIVTTNTVQHPSSTIDVVPLVADACS